LRINRQLTAELEEFSDAAANWHRPLLRTRGLPSDSDRRARREIGALATRRLPSRQAVLRFSISLALYQRNVAPNKGPVIRTFSMATSPVLLYVRLRTASDTSPQ
jgi:hypothetical protein